VAAPGSGEGSPLSGLNSGEYRGSRPVCV